MKPKLHTLTTASVRAYVDLKMWLVYLQDQLPDQQSYCIIVSKYM